MGRLCYLPGLLDWWARIRPADGHRRALVVSTPISGILEHRPAFKYLTLLSDSKVCCLNGVHNHRVSPSAPGSYFTCGRWNNSMCGRIVRRARFHGA